MTATATDMLRRPIESPFWAARLARSILSFSRVHPVGAFGGIICVIIISAAVSGPYITPDDPNAISVDVLKSPSSDHWFGTDEFGRDEFARVLVGARTSVFIAVAAMVGGMAAATALGMLSAYWGGLYDLLSQRVVDALLALPALILAMFFVTIFGSDAKNLTLVLAITVVPPVLRVARGASLGVMAQPYIEAAEVTGVPVWRILVFHVSPNIATSILVIATTGVGALILAQAGLGFLGLGISPPTPEWGQMLSISRPRAFEAPWLTIFPGAAISLTVLGFNLLGDDLRDAWDPRLRQG